MKKAILTILFFVFVIMTATCVNRVIVNPAYEVKSSGIDNIVKIELLKTATRVHVKTTFLPNWWVKFPKTTFIQPEGSDEMMLATGIEKGEFDKEIFMPASGDSLFVLIFPPLDKSVKKINYGEDRKAIIFGISLEKSNAGKPRPENKIPVDVQSWLDNELDKAKVKEPLSDFKSDSFFAHEQSRIIGYIKGYDSRLGTDKGVIYASNIITNENHPVVVNLYPDGRFEATIPMQYPAFFNVFIRNKPFVSYLEPGHTLALVLDWDEFLIADRLRNIQYNFRDVEFRGTLATINSELLKADLKMSDWKDTEKKRKTLTPDEYKAYERQRINERLELIRDQSIKYAFSQKTIELLKSQVYLLFGANLLDYALYREMLVLSDTTGKVTKVTIPDEYYDFLLWISLNDQVLLSSVYAYEFINRFEFCKPFSSAKSKSLITPEKSFIQYLKTEHQNTYTAEDEKIIEIYANLKQIKDHAEYVKYLEAYKPALRAFDERHKAEKKLYVKKYVEPLSKALQKNGLIEDMLLRDSVFSNVLHLSKPNLMYDITKVRSLNNSFKRIPDINEAEEVLNATLKDIQNRFLISEGQRMFRQTYPEDNVFTYELPDTEAGVMFKGIIAPFRGKYLIVDFWESSCGPCVAGIKQNKTLREKLKDNSNIAFLYICSEGTPKERYDQFVEEQRLENSWRLTEDQYIMMRELFKFNGIPHYEYVDREGKIMTRGLDVYKVESSLEDLLKKESEKTN